MRFRYSSICVVLLIGCAGGTASVRDSWDENTRPSAESNGASPAGRADAGTAAGASTEPAAAAADVPPAQLAARFGRAEACEAEARRIQRAAPERGWALLRACVERGRFTQLANLLQPPWVGELQRSGDAGLLIGRVIAARGGDVLGDVASLRSARVPVFALDTAMKNPALYKGRAVIFRARVDEVKPLANKKATVRLAQVYLTTQDKFVTMWGYRDRVSGSESASGSASGSYSGTRGSSRRSGSGEISGGYSASGSSEGTYVAQKLRHDNDLMDTGLVALARIDTVDPFLEPGLDVVAVGRFDGTREVPGENEETPEAYAVITLLGYFEPAKGMLAQ